MALPTKVTVAELIAASRAGRDLPATTILKGPNNPAAWKPIVTWAGSQFLDDNAIFFLAVSQYERSPNRPAMEWIFKHFVGNGKQPLPARAVNISGFACDKVFETVTGARTRALPGGCARDAFAPAVAGLSGQVSSDIDRRFASALRESATQTYTMSAGIASTIEGELRDLRNVGINL